MPNPATVLSPKNRLKNLKVLHTNKKEGWSIASMIWDNNPAFGIRWDGTSSSPFPGLGNPNVRGYPTWFVLPSSIASAILESLKISHE